MGETVEKIYCCDRDNNDNALAAAILANGNNRRDDWGPMAAMMGGGMNNWMNNPFAYLMFLALFRNGGFGGDGAGTATQGITTLPASVTIAQLGMTQGLIKIVCGKSNCYAINSSLTVTISATA